MLQVAETHEMVFCKPIKLLFGALLYIKSVQIFYTRQSLSPQKQLWGLVEGLPEGSHGC